MGPLMALERAEVGDAHPTKLTLVSVHPPVNRVDVNGQGAFADALVLTFWAWVEDPLGSGWCLCVS